MNYEIQSVSMGGRTYLDRGSLLTFLDKRSRLVVSKLKVHGTTPIETEFLRGQSFEQEIIKDAIQPPT